MCTDSPWQYVHSDAPSVGDTEEDWGQRETLGRDARGERRKCERYATCGIRYATVQRCRSRHHSCARAGVCMCHVRVRVRAYMSEMSIRNWGSGVRIGMGVGSERQNEV